MEASQILRPLRVGEILDRAFRLYRNHFFSLIGIAALALVPMTILQILSQLLIGNVQITNLVQNFFVLCLVQGSLARAIACAYLSRPFSIRAAYRSGLRRYASLWGALILQAIAIGLPLGLIACVAIAMIGPNGDVGLIILILLFVPYAAYLGTRWLVSVPSIMQEELSATEGLRRSWSLTSGVFWRVLGISIVSYLLTFLIAQLPAMAVTYGLAFFLPDSPMGSVIELTVTGLSAILTLPLSMGVMVLLYYDLRVRREGYDLELQTQELSADSSERM